MNRIKNLMGMDMLNARRDNLLLYMLIAPLFLALVLRFFLPGEIDFTPTLALDGSRVEGQLITQFQEMATVEIYDSREEVLARVERPDHVGGVTMEDGELVLILAGDEPQELTAMLGAVLEAAQQDLSFLELTSRDLRDGENVIFNWAVLLLIMTVIFLGGTLGGFNIVSERSNRNLDALRVTPLGFAGMITARTLLGFIQVLILGILSTLIIRGTGFDFFPLMGVLASALPLLALISLIIGGLAQNQVSAIGVIKLLMPIWLALPLISLFLGEGWQILFYPLPNYWLFKSLQTVFTGAADNPVLPLTMVATLGLGILFLIPTLGIIKRKLY